MTQETKTSDWIFNILIILIILVGACLLFGEIYHLIYNSFDDSGPYADVSVDYAPEPILFQAAIPIVEGDTVVVYGAKPVDMKILYVDTNLIKTCEDGGGTYKRVFLPDESPLYWDVLDASQCIKNGDTYAMDFTDWKWKTSREVELSSNE